MSDDLVFIPGMGDITKSELKKRLEQKRDFTLEQLLNMSSKEYRLFFRKGKTLNKRALLRAIIYASAKKEWGLSEERGPREFWYNPIKPILYRAFRDYPERLETIDSDWNETLAKQVKETNLTYLDLGIIDYRTFREVYEQIDRAKGWNNIILFVEKDSAYVHLLPIKRLLNIIIMSGGGWSNKSGIEGMLNELKKLSSKKRKKYILFSVTDFDPYGFTICEEFKGAAKLFGLNITEHHRIGVFPEHFDASTIEVQKYPVKMNLKEAPLWCEKHGIEGFKGKVYGLEIEAISGQEGGHSKLRVIVLTELLKYLNENDLLDEIREPLWNNAPINAIEKTIFSDDWDVPEEGLSDEFLTPKKYNLKKVEIEEQKDEETKEVKELLEELEAPFNEKIEKLDKKLNKSSSSVKSALERYYEIVKDDKWSKEKWSMNLPKGVIMKVMKEDGDIHTLIERASNNKLVDDICNILKAELKKGTLNSIINELID